MDAPKKIGRYEILQELGRGAMGTVYRAKDPAMNRVVAIKTIISVALASEQGAEFREHFYREARAAGALLHPGIVALFDVGEHEGTPFLVMECIDGRTLADATERGERLSLERVCEIGEKVAEALGYAHQCGVVHRDIKPENILVASREAQGAERPKITDFGVAKLAEAHTTITGEIRGTPAFMSPEQFTGDPMDGRSDIFSLGAVLYGMATGEKPFPGKNMTAVFYKIVHAEPVPPRKLNPAVPAKLESVILRCLEKDPLERYQSGEELARELGEVRAAINASAPESSLQRAVPGGGDRAQTLVNAPSAAWLHAAAPQGPESAAWANKVNTGWILAAVIAVAVVAFGWRFLPNRGKSNAQQTGAPLTASAPAGRRSDAQLPKQVAVAAAPAPVTPLAKAGPAAPRVAPKGTTKSSGVRTTPPTTRVAAASLKRATSESAAAAVAFDPKALDPKHNARLRIDTERTPPGLAFVVQMNGKRYLQAVSGRNVQAQDLFVPPGVQEFRVVAKSGVVQKTSNIVSADFKAKKRSTLKLELRTQGIPRGGVPQGLYPDTQIVLTLK